ncbi:DUF4388 domain-containing protein [Desulfocapsa sp. AH-315-G09]|uniref:DUF4388 domain-containing protein n=1 Tax=Desulfotalea psychrophila TaxID=84980 RepID=A0ABS3ASG1_9BACT|nr:DUF4388 domain-containing protein [Desulfocapsa sp.]MBN4065245.1 DUF4388 domain-containing protein [Desulfocapsa sp. AH-315-G09]MBN4068060.1 DUF4388 domain-containing protein [Desulfotalea psychrophila]
MKTEAKKPLIVNDGTGISLQSLLQIIEHDTASCTVSVKHDKMQRSGTLFFKRGKLIDAECGEERGLDAAYRICPYRSVSFSIGPPVERPVRIDTSLSYILLHSSVLADEKQNASREVTNNIITLQELIDFLNATNGIEFYLLLNRQGKIVLQSQHKLHPGTNRSPREDPEIKSHIALITRYAVSHFNRAINDDDSRASYSELLDDGKAVLTIFYLDMVLSVLLGRHEYAESINTFLHQEHRV